MSQNGESIIGADEEPTPGSFPWAVRLNPHWTRVTHFPPPPPRGLPYKRVTVSPDSAPNLSRRPSATVLKVARYTLEAAEIFEQGVINSPAVAVERQGRQGRTVAVARSIQLPAEAEGDDRMVTIAIRERSVPQRVALGMMGDHLFSGKISFTGVQFEVVEQALPIAKLEQQFPGAVRL